MKSKKQKLNCSIDLSSLEYWSGVNVSLPANDIYVLVIDYPFEKPGHFDIKTGKNGMGLIEILVCIRKAYNKQYIAADKDPENNYWHGPDDLCIVHISVDHNKKIIILDVDS